VILRLGIANTAFGSGTTIGPNGINSKATRLDGSLPFGFFVGLGMVEAYRSGKAGYDSPNWSAPNTVPEGVYYQGVGGMASMDSFIDPTGHSTEVAGIIIGDASAGATFEGVASKSRLHSIGVDLNDPSLIAVAAQRLALLNVVPEIVATNMSIRGPANLFGEDGRSLLSQFVDWSARVHDVLYVTIWPASDVEGYTTPGDNFNGITVASSTLDAATGTIYRDFATSNSMPNFMGAERTHIDLLAPGESVEVLGLTQDQVRLGSSFAAPHVTGAAALMHQYFETRRTINIGANDDRFLGTFNHTLAKAVLLNSADKLMGVHGSNRDVTNHLGQTWTDTVAYTSDDVPLDAGMGAGHLNVQNAVNQLAPGGYFFNVASGAATTVPLRGWAHDIISSEDSTQYIFLVDAQGWIGVTLCWDREVEHSGGSTYNYGDQFFPYGASSSRLNDLDIYLATLDNVVVASSISFEHTEEHIFAQVPQGAYKIIVNHTGGGLGTSQRYSLAWWADSAFQPGDYNMDGQINSADFGAWRSSYGSRVPAGTSGDGNYDGIVDAADYVLWRNNLTAGSGSFAAVPEPNSLMLFVVLGASLMLRRTNRLGAVGCSMLTKLVVRERS
jgi:hypothetical protein